MPNAAHIEFAVSGRGRCEGKSDAIAFYVQVTDSLEAGAAELREYFTVNHANNTIEADPFHPDKEIADRYKSRREDLELLKGLADARDKARQLLSAKFNKLADKWERETSLLSSPTRKAMHPAYQEIIAMGERVVPLILARMAVRGGHWFWALTQITNANPIPHDVRGRIEAMRQTWLNWGSERGYY